MKMKLMKWMTVTALATATVFGSFVESAEARRLQGYSRRGADQQFADQTFFLVNETTDGQIIVDVTIDVNNNDIDQSLGLFIEAIEGLNTYDSFIDSGSVDASLIFDESSLLPQDFEGNIQLPSTIIEKADLQAKLITRDEINSKLGLSVSDDFKGDIIVYSILEQNTNNVLDEVFLFTDTDLLREISNGRPTVPFPSDLLQVDFANLATNSLEDIFNANLIGLTLNTEDAQNILLGKDISNLPTSPDTFFFFFDESIEEDISDPTAIPESNTTTALLAIGTLSAGLGLKRKLK